MIIMILTYHEAVWNDWFWWRKESLKTPGKILGERTKTNNKLNPRLTPDPGFEPGRQQWFGPSFWH